MRHAILTWLRAAIAPPVPAVGTGVDSSRPRSIHPRETQRGADRRNPGVLSTLGLKLILWAGALFFLAEFFLHFFGLPVLEHDRIFLPTHDRYIAILGLTYGALLVLVSTDVTRYRSLFLLVMAGILALILNALFISFTGGYRLRFPRTTSLDHDLNIFGVGAAAWYALTWALWLRASRGRKGTTRP